MSTIPRSVASIMAPSQPAPSSSSLSEVSMPSGFGFGSESSSLGRTPSVWTQSSSLSDSTAPSLPPSPPPSEPPSTRSSSTPRPIRPPSSVAASSLKTPEASGSVSVSTPRGDVPSVRSLLDTVPSYRAPSTQGVTLEHLADELRRLADARGEETQDIADNVRALRDELRDLADFLHRPRSRPTSPFHAPSPMPHAPSPMPPAPSPRDHTPSPVAAPEPVIHWLEPPPMNYASSLLSRSSSDASSYLPSHHSDDDLWSPFPDSPYPGEPRVMSDEPEPSSPDYSPSSGYRYSPSTPLQGGSSESIDRPFPSPPPSSSPSSSSTSSTATPRPPTVLGDIGRSTEPPAVPEPAPAPDYAPVLDEIRATVDGLWHGQISTNHSLDWLREHYVPRDTELNDRMARIEDLLQSIINQPQPPVIPQPPIIPPPIETEPSTDSGSEIEWPIFRRSRVEIPDIQGPAPGPAPPGRSFAQQLDDLLRDTGTDVPLEPAERPPPVVPFTYQSLSRGIRPRSGVDITPAPPRSSTVPVTRPDIRRATDRVRAHPLPHQPPIFSEPLGPSEPDTFTSQPFPPRTFPSQGPTEPAPQSPRRRPPAPPVQPVNLTDLHRPPSRPSTAPNRLGGEIDRERVPWYSQARTQQPPSGEFDPGRPQPGGRPSRVDPPGPIHVQLPPVFDSLMDILRENRLAQLATVDQQRELMRYMRGLNEWLERDVHDRQAELRGVVARVDQLSNDIRARCCARTT
ncbi:hypothetical protein B0H16DRAFT_674985 [Mycena metata]|uniref:Uncharacterized protein n=1 Tax=Mycena metata TaxID=1033252 RepID=A0AAD7ND64_9AGAR|nr:hypothetical protein B0H16DRAFT_674985 [Mycena metata]